MKANIATYGDKYLTYAKHSVEKRKPSRFLQQPVIPERKWERLTMDFITKLPKTVDGLDTIWVIVDGLDESAHSLQIKETDKMEESTRTYIKEITRP